MIATLIVSMVIAQAPLPVASSSTVATSSTVRVSRVELRALRYKAIDLAVCAPNLEDLRSDHAALLEDFRALDAERPGWEIRTCEIGGLVAVGVATACALEASQDAQERRQGCTVGALVSSAGALGCALYDLLAR